MIQSVRLQHFRSYEDASFTLGPGVNVIAGPNASGKTNLLEAVLVLARGDSYRSADAELVHYDASWARLDAQTEQGARTVKLEVSSSHKWLKTFVIDDQALTRLSPQRMLPVVLFEPDHLLLLHGSPDLRRAYLDDLLEQIEPRFGATRRHYKRVVSQRNALLKRAPRDIVEQLFVWNVRLSELGGQIARERLKLIAECNERASELYGGLSARPDIVSLAYVSRFAPETYETSLLHKLETSTDLDIQRGFTAYGPHRDDLQVSINGHPAADAASRGETRTLVLMLKMLELELLERLREQPPMLLLDDVFSELDSKRRKSLTSFIAGHQTFITTTDADIHGIKDGVLHRTTN